jgi:co-chaperonin GroES (HSP10)
MEIHENLFQGSDEPEHDETPAYAPFEPLNQQILLSRVQEDNSTIGSFVIPEKYREQSYRGLVRYIGDKVTARINVGDIVTFGQYNTETVVVNGQEFLLTHELDLRGVERAL